MFKRISLTNALAVFFAASGMFFFIVCTTSSDVHNLAAPIARVSATLLDASPKTEIVLDGGMKKLAQNNASIDDSGKGAIDLGEFIIHAR